jgi:hypothetical protein
MANTTTPKDETLDPIRSCSIPQLVTQLKAFLGSTQQMTRALLCVDSRSLAQAYAQRINLPDRIQVDPGIRLRPC